MKTPGKIPHLSYWYDSNDCIKDIFGRTHIFNKTGKVGFWRKLRAKLGIKEPDSMILKSSAPNFIARFFRL